MDIIDPRAFKPEIYKYQNKLDYPYSYSPLVIFHSGATEKEINDSVYSDRLWQWDYNLTNELCKKHFGNEGQYFDNRKPKLIEKFLRDRLNNPKLKLQRIVEWCNVATGYPLWSFEFTN